MLLHTGCPSRLPPTRLLYHCIEHRAGGDQGSPIQDGPRLDRPKCFVALGMCHYHDGLRNRRPEEEKTCLRALSPAS